MEKIKDYLFLHLCVALFSFTSVFSKLASIQYNRGGLANPFFIAFDKAWEGRDPETANWPARRTVSCSLTLNF